MKLDVFTCKSQKLISTFSDVSRNSTIRDVKALMSRVQPKFYVERQSYRVTPTSKSLSDDTKISEILSDEIESVKLYFKDLGPQVNWTTVFLTEYTGPLVIYALIWWLRQPRNSFFSPLSPVTTHQELRYLALICWTGHFVKRLLETIFVHRFSHATMPIKNIFKNSAHYWGFAVFVSYFVNHPLYTFPSFGWNQVWVGLSLFTIAEIGNLSCHIVLRDLRPPGTKLRRIPQSTGNPLTSLFSFVACPNYTYETLAWLGFSIMTQSLPAAVFMVVGFGQMAIWGRAKLFNYRKEFKDFPKARKAIVPFVL